MQLSFLIDYWLHLRWDIMNMIDWFIPWSWLAWNWVYNITQCCQSTRCAYVSVNSTILKYQWMIQKSNTNSGRLLCDWALIEWWKLGILFIHMMICCLCQCTKIIIIGIWSPISNCNFRMHICRRCDNVAWMIRCMFGWDMILNNIFCSEMLT